MDNQTKSYWLETALIQGKQTTPEHDKESICVIGSGVTGVSCAYYLLKEGFHVTLVDHEPNRAASFRNASHVLYGTVESYQALSAFHGRQTAKDLWSLSIDVCHRVRNLVNEHDLDVDYKQDGYLVMAVDDVENSEVRESIRLLNEDGFQSDYVCQADLEEMGFRNVTGARFESGSAQVHPVKFRNELLKQALSMGLKYHTGVFVENIEEEQEAAALYIKGESNPRLFMAAVIATNAYSPLLSRFFQEQKLLEPFAGQIIVSSPMKNPINISYPHSFNRGYEYAVRTQDGRLLIGGWRDNVAGNEIGSYDLKPLEEVNQGLKDFVKRHYHIREEMSWDYSWKGIMATSSTAFPFIGPTSSPIIYTCAGFTGHGMSWGCGSAKLLADIMAGHTVPDIVRENFSPKNRPLTLKT